MYKKIGGFSDMRMRVLTHTNKGKLLAIADDVTKLISADKATDSIPPIITVTERDLLFL
jgi:hypothetical protein